MSVAGFWSFPAQVEKAVGALQSGFAFGMGFPDLDFRGQKS